MQLSHNRFSWIHNWVDCAIIPHHIPFYIRTPQSIRDCYIKTLSFRVFRSIHLLTPCILTIYALDFLTFPYIMIFLSANRLLGQFEGPVPKNLDFFGPLNGYARSHLRGQKSLNF